MHEAPWESIELNQTTNPKRETNMKTAQQTPDTYLMKMTQGNTEQTGLIFGGKYGTEQICDTGIAYWYNRRAAGISPAICDPEIERCKANARLIQSIPELLKACRAFLELDEIHLKQLRASDWGKACLEQAQIAVDKVDGVSMPSAYETSQKLIRESWE